MQQDNDVPCGRQASGQPTDAAAYVAKCGGRTLLPPSWKLT